MAWDVGSPVAVTGEDFLAAWRIEAGDESRDGGLNQRLDGRPLRVRGMMAVTDAGVTLVEFGIEHQPADRSTTGTTVYEIPIGAVDVFGAFEAWITPPADQVWGRPYIAVTGSAGEADFADIHVERTAVGQVATPDLELGAAAGVTDQQDISTTTIISRGVPSGHVLIATMDFEIVDPTAKLQVVVSFAYESTNANDTYVWLKIGQTAPTWFAGPGSAIMTNADLVFKVSAYSGPVTVVRSFEGLPLGTNTLEIHGGSTGSGSHTNTANDPYFAVVNLNRAG